MAVSYANELSLAVITTGTEAGTWGTLTNDNFQYALTQAIGGKATITFSSTTQTLTPVSNNGLQDFRALFLTCSGSPGAASTLVVPAINKLYLIKNSLTGGFDLTVKIGSSTGTVVPNGKTMLLYANGSDVIATNDYFATLTVGTSTSPAATTLNGNLTVGVTTTGTTYSTYTKTSTKVTVNGTGFGGFAASDVVYIDFSSGGAPDGLYSVDASPTPTATAFTATPLFTPFPTGTTGGNVTSITKYNNSSTLNTSLVLPTVFGSAGTLGQYLISQGTGAPPRWESLTGATGAWTVGGTFTANGDSILGSVSITFGTYNRSGTTVTVTQNNHGFSNGQILYLDFSAGTGGTATDGFYAISNVATNTFDVTDTATGTITGSPAVGITKYNSTVTLQAPLAAFGASVGTSGFLLASQGSTAPPQWVNGVSKLTNSTDKLSVDSSGNFIAVIPSGSTLLPAFFPRAWINFAPATYTTVNATYTWASTTCTVTSTAHGFETGDLVYLNFTAGAANVVGSKIFYVVTKVNDNSFTVTGASYTQATAAAVSWYLVDLTTNGASGNIRRVSVGTPGAAIGIITSFAVMFTTAMPDSSYAWTGCAGQSNNSATAFLSSPISITIGTWKRSTALQLGIYEAAGTYTPNNVEDVSLVITR